MFNCYQLLIAFLDLLGGDNNGDINRLKKITNGSPLTSFASQTPPVKAEWCRLWKVRYDDVANCNMQIIIILNIYM
jgi:hypothetical protein